jgi:hypothetical protein
MLLLMKPLSSVKWYRGTRKQIQIENCEVLPQPFTTSEPRSRDKKTGTPANIMYVWRNIAPNQEHQNGKRNSEMV